AQRLFRLGVARRGRCGYVARPSIAPPRTALTEAPPAYPRAAPFPSPHEPQQAYMRMASPQSIAFVHVFPSDLHHLLHCLRRPFHVKQEFSIKFLDANTVVNTVSKFPTPRLHLVRLGF